MKRSSLCALLLTSICSIFVVSAHARTEVPIVVIVPSYENDEDVVEKNLSSIFEQDYSNYRVIYLNDASTKKTMHYARSITARYNQEHRVTFVDNKERQGALSNVYAAMHSLADHEVGIILDGDDWWYDKNALNIFNNYYCDDDVWLSFGHYIDWPQGRLGHAEPFPDDVIANNSFRSYRLPNRRGILPVTATRACRGWLFKCLPLDVLLYTDPGNEDAQWMDTFYPMAGDYGYMVPLLELAGFHHRCILDVTYVYNLTNPISDARVDKYLQFRCTKHILGHQPFKPLQKPISVEERDVNDTVGLLLFSNNAPEQLYATLNDVRARVTPLSAVTVLYQADEFTEQRYQRIATQLKTTTFIPCDTQNFSERLNVALSAMNSNYVLVGTDSVHPKRTIELLDAVGLLKHTHTNVFYFTLGNNPDLFMQSQLPLVNLERNVRAWYCTNKQGEWTVPTIDMALWNKQYLQTLVSDIRCSSCDNLRNALQECAMQNRTLGLFYEQAQV